jgi:uncharacterized protein YndB with AHSA1/START domain
MAKTAETQDLDPPPVRLSRIFHAPREIVFRAWTSADHVERWFAPTGFTIPQASVDARVGGKFEVLMRSGDGVGHWARGTFVDVALNERLMLDLVVDDGKGHALFRAFTAAAFADAPGGTRLDVTQTYAIVDPKAAWMAQGASHGWAQTLDNLGAEVRRMLASPDAPRSVVHSAFTLERTYDAPAERVFHALADPAAKAKWFGGPHEQWKPIERSMDFRVGGRERAKGRWESGLVSTFDAVYHDIVPNARIVYTYEMWLDEKKISVSLATLQIRPDGPGRATLKVTEQGAFLDGYDDAGSRERGTGFLLDKLGASLATGAS